MAAKYILFFRFPICLNFIVLNVFCEPIRSIK